jgi:hypothetical protein
MLMLTEWSQGVETLTEQTESGKTVFLEGPMIMCEDRNRNGRIYKKAMMEKAVDTYVKDYVNERRAIGEMGHPSRPFADPKEAAIIIESLTWHGNNVIGKARVLNNPNGTIIKSLVEANFKLGVSTRGLGDVVERAGQKYVENYMMNAIDAVDMPSGQNCYVNAVNESAEWILESGMWIQKENQEKALKLFLEKFDEVLSTIKRSK